MFLYLMALFITSLNSGSNGNCYYVGNSNEAILVDVGISCKEVEKRLARLQLSISKIKALFITHEHSDHIKGLEVLSRKYNLPVYITPNTLQASRLDIAPLLIKNFKQDDSIIIGNLKVKAFTKRHDASDPYSFIIEHDNVTVGVLTDIGSVCENVISNFKKCQAVFLEANYDLNLLENGHYPYYLKSRIKSGNGHLSNEQALDLFVNHRNQNLTHLILSHLSKENNCPVLVNDLFLKHTGSTNVIVASRLQESEIYYITGKIENKESKVVYQTSLF